MKKLKFDSGVETFSIAGGGVLRFHPGDPNLYARFLQAEEKLNELEASLTQQAKELEGMDEITAALSLTTCADKKMKELLNWVLGGDNDMEQALGGVNLLAMAKNGKRLIVNLMEALEQVLCAGAETFVSQKAEELLS